MQLSAAKHRSGEKRTTEHHPAGSSELREQASKTSTGDTFRASGFFKEIHLITHETLTATFFYDPETGVFTNKTRRSSRSPVGARADLKSRGGYLSIKFQGSNYAAHRLAWFYMTGSMPTKLIDHINRVKDDNRFCNLREATHSENHQNIEKPLSSNNSGFLGVSIHRQTNKWRAQIRLNAKVRHIGLFATKEEAHEAYLKAKRQIHAFCTI